MTKKQSGQERVYSAYTFDSQFIINGMTSGQELNQSRNLEGGAMEACHLLACYTWLFYRTPTTSSGMALPTMAWTLLHSSLVEKNGPHLDLTEAFPQVKLLPL